MIVVIIAYASYYALTPTTLNVSSFSPSKTDPTLLLITLHNPTMKFVFGDLTSVQTGEPIPNRGVGAELLASDAMDHDFFIGPDQSVTVAVPMDYIVISGVEYFINLHFDGLGNQQVVYTYGNLSGS